MPRKPQAKFQLIPTWYLLLNSKVLNSVAIDENYTTYCVKTTLDGHAGTILYCLSKQKTKQKFIRLKIQRNFGGRRRDEKMAKNITIFTTNTCSYCVMVKRFLDMKGQKYQVVNLDDQPERNQEALDASGGALTVPITVVTKGD